MGSDTVHDAYREGRRRLTTWGSTLDGAEAATPVPALPGWTVKDTFSHLVGLAADVCAGGLSGPPDDAVTARQVDDRAGCSLAAVLDEWSTVGPQLEDVLAELGRDAPLPLVIDIWSHEVDMRSALQVPLPDGGAAERFLDRAARRGIGRGWSERGVPPLRIVVEDDEWVAGGDEPDGTLTTTRFELGRVMLGRRSRDQMLGLQWSAADPAPWIAAIPVFGPASIDVVDSPRA
ncbi:MAG: maleylpyruvate isomerase family mycothiol-dependent enzyme [Acidimicrobiales bacterium]|nr:maleylpyruvate isomerase family mycothiol-dependent enzyme [Acidimicrobiales bacterium]